MNDFYAKYLTALTEQDIMSRGYDSDAGKDEIARQYSESIEDQYYDDMHDEYMQDVMEEYNENKKRAMSREDHYDSDAEMAEKSYRIAVDEYYTNLQENQLRDYLKEEEERQVVDNLIGEEYDRSIEEKKEKVYDVKYKPVVTMTKPKGFVATVEDNSDW